MKKAKGIVSILVITAFLALPIISCGSDDAVDSPETSGNAQTTQEQTEDSAYTPDLPDVKFDGYVLNVLCRMGDKEEASWTTKEIYAEKENGEIINDAVYRRNRMLEERYGIQIKQQRETQGLAGVVKKLVSSGDTTYDIITPAMGDAVTLAAEGYLYNLKDLEYLDLTKGYWNQGIEKYLAVDGKLYYCTGDLNIMDNQATWVLFFNKKLFEDYKLEDPYQLVRDGKWTMDKLNTMIRGVTQDTNGDQKYGPEDLYGLITHGGGPGRYNYFAGEPVLQLNSSGSLNITINNDRTVLALEKAIALYEDNATFTMPSWDVGQAMFGANQGLFYMEVMDKVGQLKFMETPFGVLPCPKLEESQENYTTLVDPIAQFFCVPSNTSDPERTGVLLEALCAESTDTLQDAYYDKSLMIKNVRDEQSIEMIELIRKNIVYDYGILYAPLSGVGGIFSGCVTAKSTDFISKYEKAQEKGQQGLQKLYEIFKGQE